MTEEQIQYMATRFLGWRLPDDFRPDGGVSFERFYNAGTRYEGRREPVGTHLLTGIQAEAMIRYLAEGIPSGEVERLTQERAEVVAMLGCHPGMLLDELRSVINQAETRPNADEHRQALAEVDGLLAAERQRFAVAYDAAQKLAGERDEAHAEIDRLRGAIRESLAYDPYGMAGGAQIPLRALNVG